VTTTQAPKAPLLNIANALTVLRLVMVPVFVVLMLREGQGARMAAACPTRGNWVHKTGT